MAGQLTTPRAAVQPREAFTEGANASYDALARSFGAELCLPAATHAASANRGGGGTLDLSWKPTSLRQL